MYAKHFGLTLLPFENVPDPKFFFDEGEHARILSRITESLKAGRGLTVVTGHIGSGKTTLSQMIISSFSHELKLIWLAEPPGKSLDLFLFLAQELGMKPSSTERVFVLSDIKVALTELHKQGSKCLLIIDEAHLMSDDIIDGIRLLNNLEEASTKLIQVFLLGQEELMETINRSDMEPFKQRIATLEVMGKMSGDRIRKYIEHRIQVAGGQLSIFSDTGWEAVVKAFGSGSTPRVINSLCDRSLNVAFEKDKTVIDVDDVYESAQGMGMEKEVYFYKIELNQRQREKKLPPAGEIESVKEPETPGEGPVLRFPKSADDTGRPSQAGLAPVLSERGLKVPLISLALSIVVLFMSVTFYCQRAGSADLLSCLQQLAGF